MKLIPWNVRACPYTFHALRHFLGDQDPSLVSLTETQLLSTQIEGLKLKLGFRNCFFVSWRRTLMFWRDDWTIFTSLLVILMLRLLIMKDTHSILLAFTAALILRSVSILGISFVV